jgi:hypothetical protein
MLPARLRVATRLLAHVAAQRRQRPFPGAVGLPAAMIGVHGVPVGQIVGQRPPDAAIVGEVEDAVDNLADVHTAVAPTGLRGRDQRLQVLPLGVGQIAGIACAVHTATLPSHGFDAYTTS